MQPAAPAGPQLNTVRVAILGDSGVGKRTYIHKLTKKQNEHMVQPGGEQTLSQSYQFQQGTNFHLQSTHGPCQITLVPFNVNIQQYSKQQAYYNHINQQLSLCDSSLLMFSLLDRQSYKSTPNYHKVWMTVTDYNKPMVMVSTKADDWQNVKIKQKMLTFHRKKNLMFYNVCSKAGYNLIKPFQFLFRKKLSIQFSFVNVENFVDFTQQVEFKSKQLLEKQIDQLHQYKLPLIDDQQ